jgi:hypothetical protein
MVDLTEGSSHHQETGLQIPYLISSEELFTIIEHQFLTQDKQY